MSVLTQILTILVYILLNVSLAMARNYYIALPIALGKGGVKYSYLRYGRSTQTGTLLGSALVLKTGLHLKILK